MKNHFISEFEKKGYRRRWVITLHYTLFIFAFLPVFPILWAYLSRNFPDLLNGINFWIIPGIILLFLGYFITILKERDPLFYIWSALFILSYSILLYFYCEYPVEKFHLIEYGLLVILVYWTLKLRIKTFWIFPAVILYTCFVGLLDEFIQGILPNRYYEFKDVIINWASSIIATSLLIGVTWKNYVDRASMGKIRRWSIVAIAVVIFFQGGFLYRNYWKPPLNIILLTVDTFRPDHLGCYGYKRDTTPTLDSLAGKGVIFKNVIGSSPWTSPGMISIFTGLYPSSHGVQARGRSLLQSTPTIFEIFREHGYQVPNIAYLTDIRNFSNLGLGPRESDYLEKATEPGDELLRWINDHHRSRFAVWYHYRFLHLPFRPKDSFNIFLTEAMKRSLESEGVQMVQKESVIPYGTLSFTRSERDTIKALYDGQLRELDHFIERLYKRMNRWKLHRNTLLVITADHGEELLEHGFIGHASTAIHATLYDEVLKIPLILYAPSRFREPLIVTDQVRQVDIMPTILDLAGIPIPGPIHGVSLLPWIKEKKQERSLPAISESISGGYQSNPDQEKIMLYSIRTGGWKLICKRDNEMKAVQLFNLNRDPEEKINLIDQEHEMVKKLKERLYAQMMDMETDRLAMLAKEKAEFHQEEIPAGAKPERPVILTPGNNSVIHLKEGRQVLLSWTGDHRITYIMEYDVGKGWRNMKGSIPIKGNRKVFGPLPREAWEPLPYWNPYRIRVSPHGMDGYWSKWVEFSIEVK